jgi:DNA-binding transcriptional LysR family regulator
MEVGTVEGILACVAGDIGVAVLPRSVVDSSRVRDALRAEPFTPEPMRVPTLLVRRADVHAGSLQQAFDDAIDAAARLHPIASPGITIGAPSLERTP